MQDENAGPQPARGRLGLPRRMPAAKANDACADVNPEEETAGPRPSFAQLMAKFEKPEVNSATKQQGSGSARCRGGQRSPQSGAGRALRVRTKGAGASTDGPPRDTARGSAAAAAEAAAACPPTCGRQRAARRARRSHRLEAGAQLHHHSHRRSTRRPRHLSTSPRRATRRAKRRLRHRPRRQRWRLSCRTRRRRRSRR